jgi:hypothetical protein
MTLKNEILRYIINNPGCRKRTIAAAMGIWQCDVKFLSAICELKQEKMIKSELFRDPANMDYYYKFYSYA